MTPEEKLSMRKYSDKLSVLTGIEMKVIKHTLMAEYSVGGVDLAGAYVDRVLDDIRLNQLAENLWRKGMDGLQALDELYSARLKGNLMRRYAELITS